MSRKFAYQHTIAPGQVPYAPIYTASNPTAVMGSPVLRRAISDGAAVILHPTRGTIHNDHANSPLAGGRGRKWGPIVGRLVSDDPGRTPWRPRGNWMRPFDQMGAYTASAVHAQPVGVRLMADGSLRAGAAFIQRERDMEDYGWSNVSVPAEVGAEIDVPNVVEHLRVIKMFPELIGRAPMEFHVAKGFRTVPAPWLDFRIAARDPVVGKNFRQGPGTEPRRLRSHFYEAFLTCRKDREFIEYPDETRLRATEHDPMVIDRETAAYSLAFKRNQACIQELFQIGNFVKSDGEASSSISDTLSEISARNANGTSTNNPLKELQTIVTKQFLYNRVRMAQWFMNPITFLHLTQNDYVRSGGEFGRTPVSIPYGGMIQMPTMPGINIICDARLDSKYIHMTDNRQLLWLGEGPKKVQTIDQRIRQQMSVDFTDYYDAYCIHRDITAFTKRRFGCTVRTAAGDQI